MEGIVIFIVWIVVIGLGIWSKNNSNDKKMEQNKPNLPNQPPNPNQINQAQARPQPKPQPKAQAAAKKVPDIVQRAMANTKMYEADETLEELEEEHQHSELVSTAQAAYVAKERQAHKEYHETPHIPIEEESSLGTVEDLMVKGYSGNLSFERDFVGEGLDMINRFTLV